MITAPPGATTSGRESDKGWNAHRSHEFTMSSPKLRDVSSPRGAPMGRNGCRPLDFTAPLKFYLRRVPLNSGGYDSGGAYWGLGSPLYYACSVDEVRPHNPYGPPGELRQVELFARAYDRDDAKAIVRQECPHATFFN